MRPRTRKALRVAAVIAAVLAALYAGLTLWSVTVLRRAYAALERDGRPMKLADILPPPIPDADNAAPLYEKALKILKTEKIGDQTLMERLLEEARQLRTTNMTATALAGFREAIQTPAAVEAMGMIVQGTLRKDCRFQLFEHQDHAGGMVSNRFALKMELFNVNRIVAWESRRLAVDGKLAAAMQMTVAEMRLARTQVGNAGLSDQLLEVAKHAIVLATVQMVCARRPPSKDEAATLVLELARFDDPGLFAKAMDGERLIEDGERFFRLEGIHSLAPFQRQNLGALLGMNRLAARAYLSRWNPVLRLDHAAYIYAMRRPVTTSPEDTSGQADVPWWCRWTRIVLSGHESIRTSFTAHLARVRCTEAGLAVLIFRREHGTWPETLASCMEKVPVAPFDGKPLRYRVTEKGFVVSSVGKTGRGKWEKEIAWECEPAL